MFSEETLVIGKYTQCVTKVGKGLLLWLENDLGGLLDVCNLVNSYHETRLNKGGDKGLVGRKR